MLTCIRTALLHVADVSIRLVSQPDHVHDWLDYVTLITAVLVALGTIGAVLAALFGPRWHARRRRPALYAQSTPRSIGQSRPRSHLVHDSPPAEFTFELGNPPGHDTAESVEVFLSTARAVTDGTAIGGLQRVPLIADMSVPANFRRPVPLLLLGTDVEIRQALGSVGDARQADDSSHQTVSFVTRSPSGPQWLDPDSYDVTLFVTGSNFDAIRFDGALRVSRTAAANSVSTGVSWEADLRQVPMDATRPRRSPTNEEVQQRLDQDRRDDQC